MSKDDFWNLISEVKAVCGQDQGKYMDTLTACLEELGHECVKDFHNIVHAYENLACKYGHWSAAGLINFTSDDSFIDFRAWLISQDKEAYYASLKDPDTLADLDSGDGYWFEGFTYAGYFALEGLTGEDAYASHDKAAHENIVRALKADIEYAEWINYPFMPSTRLWHQAENHIGGNEIDIAAMKPRRLDAMAYVCYALARDIVTGSRTVALAELADPSLLSPRCFLVIQTAGLWRMCLPDSTLRATLCTGATRCPFLMWC